MPFAFLQTTIIVCLVLGLCRVGSLEMNHMTAVNFFGRFMPCRQFRKANSNSYVDKTWFMPCRQFRKMKLRRIINIRWFMPSRQFRNASLGTEFLEFRFMPSRQFRN